jgi:hypothetical protein
LNALESGVRILRFKHLKEEKISAVSPESMGEKALTETMRYNFHKHTRADVASITGTGF